MSEETKFLIYFGQIQGKIYFRKYLTMRIYVQTVSVKEMCKQFTAVSLVKKGQRPLATNIQHDFEP